MSDDLRRERDDLHEPLVAQLAPHRPEDAGRAGLALVGNEHGGVLVEADVGAVLALGLLGRAHDHRPHHLPLLDLARADGVLDRDHDDVSQPAVAALRPTEHADHERAARARIVRDLENRFLLDHGPSLLSGPARGLRPRASAWSSTAAASPRCAPYPPPWRPCRCEPRPAWCGPPACRRSRARSGAPAKR